MGETRGYETINDRSDGWGPGVDGEDQPTADATPEDAATRVARALAERKTFAESPDPAIVDRSVGYGGTFDPTAGAGDYGIGNLDEETPVTLPDPADYAHGVFYDASGDPEAGTGNNTPHSTTDSEATATGRTADTRTTVQLNDATEDKRAEAQRASILDRNGGWGHEDGSFTYRKDS